MINRTVLVGRLTRDPELRYTQNGAAVAGFTLAVNRQFTNSQGEREADFVNCVIWRKAAENFANFTHKGSLVGIDGRIQTRNYDNQQGQKVYVTEVVVDNFSLLESRSESEKRSSGNGSNNSDSNQAPNYNQQNQSNQTSYGNNNSQSNNNNNNNNNQSNNLNNNMGDPFADNSKPIDISDDDLPF
ncbi:single-stranded DNA-binding protein [Companilactobacillus bobalius]|uniref:Single-stranded DNA-binding protein n=2 Tax=Companilactobacillus bobalius TaxID=2801451 RepID=A0A202F7S0_9LACO|nr:single-stranded DNA-binding protein [Companilactobacillus bobalius]GEO58504.1 single-stranded DNA-binding protein [Companilactobacillus paralimentarius]KAE9557551.1 single-stranded DNA-binding protein [Companilactobacillus bobalius]KAE9563697.1 single-stranded DNA-binding protein [Companilactobacillus bobalius]KRK83441.1 single-strand DNA binding protein [Companilactobacillus bobalius DSM 19674]OVE96521.1 Single-stranded DNA-binding protein [Companilactobacillus bobalius]